MKKSNINHAHVFTIIFIISFLLISSQSKSGNFIWNGSIDSQWAKANNWSPSGIPSGQDTIQIMSSSTNIVLDSSRTVTRFIMQSDTIDLGGFTLVATGSSVFTAGLVTNGTLDLRGSAAVFSGTKINATTSAVCSKATFQNTIFMQPVVIDITGSVADTSLGNNVFQNTLSLRNSGGASVIMAYGYADSILGDFTVYDTLSHTILLGYNDTSYFGGNIYVGSTGAGVSFGGNTTGFVKLASGKTISVSAKGYSAGTLLLNNFIQAGTTAQSLTLTGSSILSIISSSFGGAVTFTSPNILVKSSTFNGKSIFSRSSSVSNSWEGGNTFMGVFRFTNTGSGNIMMQTSYGDTYEDSVTINAGSARFYPSTVEESVYKNNLYFTGSYVDFNQGIGTTKFAGSINQVISGSSSLKFKNLIINKSSGTLTLQAPITITNTLDFVNGNIITDTTHLLTFASGSSWLHGGNNSFASGPVIKQGNSASFTFPSGKGSEFNPISITGSLNTTDAFLAEYFNTGQTVGDSLSDSIKYVYDCNYWKLKQTTGSSNVYVTLGWDKACVLDTGLLRIANWDGAKWADLGRGTFTGTVSGTITSAVSGLQNYYVALANPVLIVVPALSANASRNVENFYGISGANTFRNTDHDWRFSNDADDELKNNVHGLHPGLLKFNAGAQGNYLNWRRGSYFDDEHYEKYNQLLPDNYFSSSFYDENYINYDIRLEQFKNALTFSGAIPIFQVNITSSDIDFQVGLLLEAKRLNISVKYIELGGEVNIDKEDGNNARAFASGLEYAQTAYQWTRRIKVALGEDVQVGVVASNNQDDIRRKYWNEKMIAEFFKLETPAALGPDAMIIHQYLHDVVPGGQAHQRQPITDFDRMFCTPFLDLTSSYHNANGNNYCLDDDELAEIENLKSNRYNIWLTEYGLDDAYWMVHGSWGGGLFNALQTLLYLENDKITMAVNFTLWSNCVFGNIFVDDNAFRFDGDPDETNHQFIFNGMPANYKNTVTDQYSAQGHAMKHIGKAMKNAVSGQQLTFPNPKQTRLGTFFDTDASHTPFTINGLYGWHFSDNATTPKDQMVILNLTGLPVQVDLSQIGAQGTWTNYDITYTSPDLFPLGDNESCMDWTGNTGSTSINPEDPPPFNYAPLFDYPALSVSASGLVFMPAYSIVRIYNCAMPDLTVTASAENICSGEEVTLTLNTPMEDGWNIDSWNVNINGNGNSPLNHFTTPYTTDDFSMPYTFNNCTPEIREYSVTFTNSGCGTSSTVTSNPVTVYIYPPVEVEITTSQANPCPGSQIQLTAAPGSSTANCYNGVNYVWITGDGDGIGTTNPLTVNADKLTNYIAYANFAFTNQITQTAFNCAAYGELELGPDPPPAGLPDDTIVCYGDQFNINLSQYNNSNYTCLWKEDGITIDSDYWLDGYTPDNTAPHVITFEVTHNTTNCLLSHDMTVYASECCFDDNFAINANYNNEDEAATLEYDLNSHYPGIASYDVDKEELQIDFNISSAPDQLFVNGKWAPEYSVKITGFEFTGSELSMSEGAQIDVLGRRKFTIYGGNLHACTERQWRGIKLHYNSAIKTEFYDTGDPQVPRTIISDAEYAVTASNLTKADLQHTDFINNHVGFYIPPMVQFSYNTVDLLNRANTFSSDGNMLNEYMGQTTLTAGHHSYAGMLLNNFNGVIGLKGSTNPLNFNHINNGILAFNCNLLVTNSKFKNINYYDYGPPAFKMFAGSAIFAHGDGKGLYSLSQEGLGKTNNIATFDNCRIGVAGVRTTLDISENKMTEMESGISNYMSMLRSVNIYNNNISTSFNGIHSSFGDLSIEVNIHNNDITLNNATGNGLSAGIAIDEALTYNTPNLKVNDNEITVTSGGNGISLNATKHSKVYGNIITLNDDVNTVNGININSCLDVDILGNEITGTWTSTNSNLQTAIRTYATTFSDIEHNITYSTYYGLYFDEECDATYMTCNEMHDQGLGTYVDVLGFFNHQHLLAGNEWIGNYTTIGTGFTYLGTIGLLYPPAELYTAAIGTDQWPDSYTPGFFQTDNWVECHPQNSIPFRPVFDSLDFEIASHNLSLNAFEDEYNYIAKTNLYYKADLYFDSIPEESSIDSFYTANENTSIGRFRAINKIAKNLFAINATILQNIKSTDSLIVVLLDSMTFCDSLLYSEIAYNDSIELMNKRIEMKELIYSLFKDNNGLMAEIDSMNSIYSDSIITENSTISVSSVIEQNQKTINEIYFNTISKGIYTFDSAQAAEIYAIASQCPISGGKAVPVSRGIYRLINDTLAFDDTSYCQQESARLAKNGNVLNNSFIYPNPSTNKATLKYSLLDEKDGWFIVFNILGEEIFRLPLTSKKSEKNFSCEPLNEGLYIYKVLGDDKLVNFGKFSVIR